MQIPSHAFSCPLKSEQLPNADVDGSKARANCHFCGQSGDFSGDVSGASKFGTSAWTREEHHARCVRQIGIRNPRRCGLAAVTHF
jgi:hypothetical protein